MEQVFQTNLNFSNKMYSMVISNIFNLSRYAENGALFSELFTAALRENGTLCLAVNRHLEADEYDDDPDDFVRVVLGCPDNDLRLEPDDNIIALVQFDHLKEKTE